MNPCLFFEEEKDEEGNTKRKGENSSCSGVSAGLPLCHWSTILIGRKDVHL